MTEAKIEAAWERIKDEIPRTQFDAIVRCGRLRLGKGWKHDGIGGEGRTVVWAARDPSGHRRQIKFHPDGSVEGISGMEAEI